MTAEQFYDQAMAAGLVSTYQGQLYVAAFCVAQFAGVAWALEALEVLSRERAAD